MTHDQDDAVLPEGDLSASSSSQDDEEEDDVLDEEDDVDDDDDVINLNSATSNSSSPHSLPVAVAVAAAAAPPAVVTVASLPVAPLSVTPITPTAVVDGAGGADPKWPRTIQYDPVIFRLPTAAASTEEKKPVAALDDSRRLFQRLWTDEDEIELLQGFLDYTTQRGNRGGGGGQNDTALFYDQIKSKLQLEFNKNQLVEKLRRLKKKYRNLLNKIAAGKDVSFKSPHDQATFEISRKIWRNIGRVPDALDDEEQPNPNHSNFNLNSFEIKTEDSAAGGFQKSTPRSRKRSRPQSTPLKPPPGFVEPPAAAAATITTVIKENHHSINNGGGGGGGGNNSCGRNCNVQGLIEETVKSCLSPLFKELVSNAMGGGGGGGQQSRGFGGMSLNPIPLSFGGPPMNLNFGFGGGEAVEEQWRNQQILELEVYSKRLELVQNQIKVAVDELRSTTGGGG